MPNKTLVVLAAAPMVVAFSSGVFGFGNDGLEAFCGFLIIVFGGWALVRLFNTPDTVK